LLFSIIPTSLFFDITRLSFNLLIFLLLQIHFYHISVFLCMSLSPYIYVHIFVLKQVFEDLCNLIELQSERIKNDAIRANIARTEESLLSQALDSFSSNFSTLTVRQRVTVKIAISGKPYMADLYLNLKDDEQRAFVANVIAESLV
jgi:hypothetical protein